MLILLAGRRTTASLQLNKESQCTEYLCKKADSFELGFSNIISPAHATMQDNWVGANKVHLPSVDDKTFKSHLILLCLARL